MVARSSGHPEIRVPGNISYDLLDETVTISGSMVSNGRMSMNNEFERM
jgi:hypothetical protein